MKKGDYVRRITEDGTTTKKGTVYRVEGLDSDGDPIVDGGNVFAFNFEPVKVAVHCTTEDEWDRVIDKAMSDYNVNHLNKLYRKDSTIGLPCEEFRQLTVVWSGDKWYSKNGYHIITAQEYLGEEDMTETERKFGSNRPRLSEICKECGESYGWHSGSDPDAECREKKTIKQNKGEDTMNKNIVAVFEKTVDAVTVTDYLTDEIKERIILEVHKDAILEACNAAKEEANKD